MKGKGIGTLKNVVMFEKPKYAICVRKGKKNYNVYEILGVGETFNYDCSRQDRKDNLPGAYETSPWFRFLYMEYGSLWTLDKDNIVLLHEEPTKKKIIEIIKFINNGGEADCFSTNEYYYDELFPKEELK